MPLLSLHELERELAKKIVRPVYVIVGQESLLATRALEFLRHAVLGNGPDASLARTTLSGKEVKWDAVIAMLRNVSLLGERPFVVIREAEGLSKDLQSAVAQYLERPVDEASLVLVAAKLDGRGRLMQAASKHGSVVECKPLYANQVPSWVTVEARRIGKQMSQEAARYLADLVGTGLGELSAAIERVALFVGDRPVIELADVERSIAASAQRTIFELTDAVGERRLDRALGVLENLLDQGQAPVMIVAMIARHMRLLTKAREALGNIPEGEMARHLGVHPFFAKTYVAQARNFSSMELMRAFRLMARVDRELKSSRKPRERILEKLLIDLGTKGAPKTEASNSGGGRFIDKFRQARA